MVSFFVSATNPYIDSLITEKKTNTKDSLRYDALRKLAIAYSDSAYDISIMFWEEALDLAKRKRNKQWLGDVYHQIGYMLHRKGEFPEALDELKNALIFYEQNGNITCIAEVYNDMGLIYKSWGKYEQALECFLTAMPLFEKVNFTGGSAMVANNIGQIYYYRENYSKAIEYFKNYLKINQISNTYRAVAGALNNIASAYMEMGDFDLSLEFYLKALSLYDSLEVKLGVAIINDNIGSLYAKKEKYSDALVYHFNALNLFKEFNSKPRISYVKKNIGYAYYKQKQYSEALDYFMDTKLIAEELGQREILKEVYFNMSNIYESLSKYSNALEAYKQYVQIKDSLLSIEINEKLTTLELQYESDKKSRELEMIKNKYEQQKRIGLIVSSIGFVFLFLSLMVIRENIQKKKGLNIYQKQNTLLKNSIKSILRDTNSHLYGLEKHFKEHTLIPGLSNIGSTHFLLSVSKKDITVILEINYEKYSENLDLIKLQCFGWLNEILEQSISISPLQITDYIYSKLNENSINSITSSKSLVINALQYSDSLKRMSYIGQGYLWHANNRDLIINKIKTDTHKKEENEFDIKNGDIIYYLAKSKLNEKIISSNQDIASLLETTLKKSFTSSYDDQKALLKSTVDFWNSSYEIDNKFSILIIKV
jgi:tetratricopeptide (TPR) repeat protein